MPVVSLASPVGGETLPLGQPIEIRWQRIDHPATVSVFLNRNYPSGIWETLADNTADTVLVWTVNGKPTTTARIRVQSTINSAWRSETASNLIIAPSSLLLTAPAQGAAVVAGDSVLVAWQRLAAPAPVRVLLRRTSGITDTLCAGATGSSVNCLIRGPVSAQSRVIIEPTQGTTRPDSVSVSGPQSGKPDAPAATRRGPVDHWP